MKKVFIFFCMFIISNISFSQYFCKDIYKVYTRKIDGCRSNVEEIILYKDSTFMVYSCIGGVGTDYMGGWWINDSVLILQPSQNCRGPFLIYKKEYQDNKTDGVRIEVYNEKGKLIHYSTIDGLGRNKVIFHDGCILLGLKDSFSHRYLRFSVKGKVLVPISAKKKNNVLEIIILEPSTNSDIYIGKQTILLKSLTESF